LKGIKTWATRRCSTRSGQRTAPILKGIKTVRNLHIHRLYVRGLPRY